jgi:hypothetical protein
MRGQPASSFGNQSRWLRIDTPPEPGYSGNVVNLVATIARTPSGRTVLEGIRDSGGSVMIEPPAATDPPNATVARESSTPRVEDLAARPAWYIGFHPDDWPSPLDPEGRSPEVVLFLLLREALARLRSGPDAPAPVQTAETEGEEPAAIAQFQQERNL